MSMKIFDKAVLASDSNVPAGWGKAGLIWKGVTERRLNYIPVIRDCVSNFENYPPKDESDKKMFAALVGFKEGALANMQFLVVAHNGEKFKNLDDILLNGCTPNKSGAKEDTAACFGAGLSHGAAMLNDFGAGLLGIVSKMSDGTFVGGAGRVCKDLSHNKWVIDEAPELVEAMHAHFDKKTILDVFNVFYFFSVPYTADKYDPNTENLNRQMMATLSLSCGAMLEGVDFNFVEKLFVPNFTFLGKDGAEKTACDNTLVLSGGSYGRPLKGKQEFITALARNIEPDIFEVEGFDFGMDDEVFHGKAELKIYRFDGEKKNDNGWYDNARDNSGTERPFPQYGSWEKGKASGWGIKPEHQSYLIFDCFGDEKTYKRYQDNSVMSSDSTKLLLQALGVTNYTGQNNGRVEGDNPDRPFVILDICVTGLDKKTKSDGFVENSETVKLEFLDNLGRRSDHMISKTHSFALMKKIMQAAGTKKNEPKYKDLFKWFEEKFPTNEEEFTPIDDSDGKDNTCRYRMFNVADDGSEFNSKLHLGCNENQVVLAIYDCVAESWVSTVEPTSSTRGLNITTMDKSIDPIGYKKWLSTKIDLKTKVEAFVGCRSVMNIPLHIVEIAEEITTVVAGKTTRFLNKAKKYDHDAAFAAYEASLETKEVKNFFPSRSIRVKHGANTIHLGIVQEVPKPPKRIWKKDIKKVPGKGGCAKGLRKSKHEQIAFETRHQEVALRFDEDNNRLTFNPEYTLADGTRPFIIFKNKDSFGTKTQRIAQKIHDRVKAMVFAVSCGLHGFTLGNLVSMLDKLPHKNLDEEGNNIYDKDGIDYPLNKAVDHLIRNEKGDASVLALLKAYEEVKGTTSSCVDKETTVKEEVMSETQKA